MTFSFKGPSPGLACAWTIHFKRCQCEEFGSHTVLWLISHFYFLLYDVFAIRLLSVLFFPILFRTCMKLFNLFSEKGEAGGRAKSKERTLVLMFKQPRICSQFLTWWWVILPGICWFMLPGVVLKRKCIVQSSSAGYSPNSVFVWNQIFYTKSDKWETIV